MAPAPALAARIPTRGVVEAGNSSAVVALVTGTGTRRMSDAAETARKLAPKGKEFEARRARVERAVLVARHALADAAVRTVRTDAAVAPGTPESFLPEAVEGTGGSAARAAAGRAPRRAGSPRSSDGVSWHCRETVTSTAWQIAGPSNG